MDFDTSLQMGRRALLHQPRYLTLGPTGRRLFAEALEQKPGFVGCIDFIHKLNIPMLFTLHCGQIHWDTASITWQPSHLTMTYQDEHFSYLETKIVTWDDCAISVFQITNNSECPLPIKVECCTQRFIQTLHGFSLEMHFECSIPQLLHGITLAHGESIEFACVMGCKIAGEATVSASIAKSWSALQPQEICLKHKMQYLQYFKDAPTLCSNNALLDKTWNYRLFMLRHNIEQPSIGHLQHLFFCEGRSHKMTKTAYAPSGWEFTKLIPLSAPMHLLDTQWFLSSAQAQGIIHTMMDNQLEDGLFHCAYTDKRLDAYANFFAWAVYEYILTSGDIKTAREVLPALKRQVEAWRVNYGNVNDLLMRQTVHQLTGKEYQPSYWYFHAYPENPTDPSMLTPLKRVDMSVDFVMNLRGVSGLCGLLGYPADAKKYADLALRAGNDIRSKMWDASSGYFYDLHHETDQKAYVKNITSFYPAWAGLSPQGAIEKLFSTDFSTFCPFPSISTDEPMFSPSGGWKGNYFKGRNGCVWNGPSWPYTNSLMLDALARESKLHAHCYDKQFAQLLHSFCLQHYADRDLARHGLSEHYNPLTGEALSGEVDYLHSYFLDLVIRHMAGLHATAEGLQFEPIQLKGFELTLTNVGFRGRNLTIILSKGKMHVSADGAEMMNAKLGEVGFVPMPIGE